MEQSGSKMLQKKERVKYLKRVLNYEYIVIGYVPSLDIRIFEKILIFFANL